MKNRIINKTEAMIFWGIIWDSLGIPVEMQTKDQIQSVLTEYGILWNKVTTFLPPTLHKLYREWDYDQNIEVVSSDDTYCTRAAMNSIIEREMIDLTDMMEKNIHFYNEFNFGYGWTTKKAYRSFEDGESVYKSGNPGWWNGVIMKLAPLSIYLTLRWYDEETTSKYLNDFTKMTHTHESVVLGSYVHHKLLEALLQNSTSQHINDVLEDVFLYCKENETEENIIPLSPILEKLIYLYQSKKIENISDDEILKTFWWWTQEITKFSWRIDITLGMCYALFFRNPTLSGILDAVSIGWDTDTYGAIVWNMVWAFTWDKPSEKYLSKIPEIETIKQETQRFIQLLESL